MTDQKKGREGFLFSSFLEIYKLLSSCFNAMEKQTHIQGIEHQMLGEEGLKNVMTRF